VIIDVLLPQLGRGLVTSALGASGFAALSRRGNVVSAALRLCFVALFWTKQSGRGYETLSAIWIL
jgi:hypothetical protein